MRVASRVRKIRTAHSSVDYGQAYANTCCSFARLSAPPRTHTLCNVNVNGMLLCIQKLYGLFKQINVGDCNTKR